MAEFILTIVALAAAITVPAFWAALVETTAVKHRAAPVRLAWPGGRTLSS